MSRALYFSALSSLTSAFMILKFRISPAMTRVHLKRRNMSFRYISESFRQSRKTGRNENMYASWRSTKFLLFAIFFFNGKLHELVIFLSREAFFYLRLFVAHLWQVARGNLLRDILLYRAVIIWKRKKMCGTSNSYSKRWLSRSFRK